MTDQHRTLLVFARELAAQLRTEHYRMEWSQEPLHTVLQATAQVLDAHPKRIGSIIMDAFQKSSPATAGNIDQLAILYPGIFGKSREYFTDAYEVWRISRDTQITERDVSGELSRVSPTDVPQQHLAALALATVDAFASLTSAQENQHRTLETMSRASTPVYYAYGLVGIGFDMSEYADQWRSLTENERQKLAKSITGIWR